jgi:hypothetical protein
MRRDCNRSKGIKIPYEDGIEDAVAVEIPAGQVPVSSTVIKVEGNEIKVEMHVKNMFRLLNKKDEKGEPIYLFTLQLKTETIAKAVNTEGGE